MKLSKKEIVYNLLKKNIDGLTITEIASILKIARNTVSVALAELKGKNKIKIRKIGMCKLHYIK